MGVSIRRPVSLASTTFARRSADPAAAPRSETQMSSVPSAGFRRGFFRRSDPFAIDLTRIDLIGRLEAGALVNLPPQPLLSFPTSSLSPLSPHPFPNTH